MTTDNMGSGQSSVKITKNAKGDHVVEIKRYGAPLPPIDMDAAGKDYIGRTQLQDLGDQVVDEMLRLSARLQEQGLAVAGDETGTAYLERWNAQPPRPEMVA